jgi:hypothetical protein
MSHEFGVFWESIFSFQELVVQIWRLIGSNILVAHLLESECGIHHDLLKVESRWNSCKIRLFKKGFRLSWYYWHFLGGSRRHVLTLLWWLKFLFLGSKIRHGNRFVGRSIFLVHLSLIAAGLTLFSGDIVVGHLMESKWGILLDSLRVEGRWNSF